jgi:hypothetical protein
MFRVITPLPTFGDVNNKYHQIYDLCTPDDGADQGCMARAIYQCELKLIIWKVPQVLRQRHLQGRQAACKWRWSVHFTDYTAVAARSCAAVP